MTKIAISIDPGGTTGITIATIDAEKVSLVVKEGQYREVNLRDILTTVAPHYIICETFEYRNKARAGLVLDSRNLIGIVNLYVSDNPQTRLFMQSPAQAKSFFTNEKLKKLELYPVGLAHGRDSLRHFLRWYKFGYGAQYDKGQTMDLVRS